MNSSKKRSSRILGAISEKEACRLLLDLVNTDPFARSNDGRRRLLRRHPAVFAGLDAAIYDIKKFDDPAEVITPERQRQREVIGQVHALITSIVAFLRSGWNEADPRCQEWQFIKARLAYHSGMQRLGAAIDEALAGHREIREVINGEVQPHVTVRSLQVDSPEELHLAFLMQLTMLEIPLTEFDAAVFHLQTIADRIRRCPDPSCPARYFLAGRRSQKYCSTACAAPAQRKFKRDWWRKKRGKR